MYRETLDEYMASYEELEAKIERYDKRIEEIAAGARCRGNAKKLGCLLGIRTHTALSLIVETGDINIIKDFERANANNCAMAFNNWQHSQVKGIEIRYPKLPFGTDCTINTLF